MNTRDANRRGIRQGDLVTLRTKRGQVNLYALVTDDIVEGAVEANAMGGGPAGGAAWRKANINELTDLNRYDPISGFPVYKALLCEVSRIEEGVDESALGSGEYKIDLRRSGKAAARTIYLDHNATTPVHPEVANAVSACL